MSSKTNKYPVKSKKAERAVIKLSLLDEVNFIDMMKLSQGAFPSYPELYDKLVTFYNENHTTPDLDSFSAWCQDPDVVDQLQSITKTRAIKENKFPVYTSILRHAMIGQEMLNIAGFIADNVGKEDPHPKLLQSVIGKLTDLTAFSSDRATTTRRLICDDAKERWENFLKFEKNPELLKGVPFGIAAFDSATGGLHSLETEADIVVFFGKAGSQKSRMLLNLAYNVVSEYKPIMYITREMSQQRVTLLFDSRESLNPPAGVKNKRKLDFASLQKSYLVGRFKRRYEELLKNMYKNRRYPFWLVDIPEVMTTIDIIRELELHKTRFGEYPRVIYLDYANLVDPIGECGREEHQKLDCLFLELLAITRSYRIPLVTVVRESRTGSLKKERDEIGLEHIGLSQAIGFHVHVVIHLDQTKDDAKAGILYARSKKNRYGPLFDAKLRTLPEYGYIGDWDGDNGDSYEGLD